jgi:hypothetical protein
MRRRVAPPHLDDQYLGSAGVQAGDILRLQPEITAG